MKMNNQFFELEYDLDGNMQNDVSFQDFVTNIVLHYSFGLKKWVHRAEYMEDSSIHWYPATFPCKSYKAALRHLRQHDEIPKGTKFVLVSKYVECDRYLVKK